jgi:hypothetical protein
VWFLCVTLEHIPEGFKHVVLADILRKLLRRKLQAFKRLTPSAGRTGARGKDSLDLECLQRPMC